MEVARRDIDPTGSDRFAVLRLRDQDAAEDLVQNSLIAGVRNLGSWRGEATLFTWLCTICRREISAWEKRTSRRVMVSLAEDDPGVRAALESIGAAAEAPDAGLARADTGRIVQLVDYAKRVAAIWEDLIEFFYAERPEYRHVGEEIHPGETSEEKVSLSERFGLWVSFYPFDQEEYLKIVAVWLEHFKAPGAHTESVQRAALQWALQRGSRSGRVAWQFARDWAGRQRMKGEGGRRKA